MAEIDEHAFCRMLGIAYQPRSFVRHAPRSTGKAVSFAGWCYLAAAALAIGTIIAVLH